MKLVVSRCLLGDACRYDGGSKHHALVRRLAETCDALAICPECAGGLPVPRPPAERSGGRYLLADGRDVTAAFEAGAAASVEAARAHGGRLAVLKAKSPSCGSGAVYDGTFTGTLVPGDGAAAALFKKEGFTVITETELETLHPTVEHPVALMLGSGMSHLADLVRPVRRIPYSQIPGFPQGVQPVAGHRFEVTIGTLGETPVVVYPGRIHLYQGANASQVTALVRHAHHLGCRNMVVVAASGAIQGMATPGIGLVTDQLNLTGQNPLTDEADLRHTTTPFISMRQAYTPALQEIARSVAADKHIALQEGVYAGTVGPSFETPAEVRALATLGASFVGFSVVLETIMASALDMGVLGLTLCANTAGQPGVSHDSVLSYAREHGGDLETLIQAILDIL
jgi:purine-nucleoside phosphorylase